MLSDPNFHCQDQWQVQILSQIAKKSNINLYTEGLSDKEIENAFMFNAPDPQRFIDQKVKENINIRGCVLPEGPITIPVVGLRGSPGKQTLRPPNLTFVLVETA